MKKYQNQPFLFKNEFNEEILLYCESDIKKILYFNGPYEVQPWKIKVKTGISEFRPNLPEKDVNLGEIVIECNPHIQIEDNYLFFYYIAGFCKGDNFPIVYYLCSLKTNWNLSEFYDFQIHKQCFSGTKILGNFYYTKKTIYGDHLMKNDEDLGLQLFIKNIYRICPVFNEPTKMIITANSLTNQNISYLVDLISKEKKEIKNKFNENVYKCTILDKKLIYTSKNPNSEERYLIEDVFNE